MRACARSARSRVTGPPSPAAPQGSSRPSIARDRLQLARRGGEERLVGRQQLVERAGALLDVGELQHERAGDRGEDVVLQRRRADARRRRPRRSTRSGASSTRPCGRDEQRLVGALLLRDARGEHVGGVGERLDAVEQARAART